MCVNYHKSTDAKNCVNDVQTGIFYPAYCWAALAVTTLALTEVMRIKEDKQCFYILLNCKHEYQQFENFVVEVVFSMIGKPHVKQQ